jgi:N-acetylmuramidase
VADEAAALQSESWWAFQIMGANFAGCGFQNVGDFVDAMLTGKKQQLDAFVAFIDGNRSLKTSLQTPDWTAFAIRYNGDDGRGHVVDGYDTRIAQAYASLKP